MTLRMTKIYLAAQTRVLDRVRAHHEDDRGQGTLEYVGIAVLIGLIMVAIFGLNLQTTIANTIKDAVSKITGGK